MRLPTIQKVLEVVYMAGAFGNVYLLGRFSAHSENLDKIAIDRRKLVERQEVLGELKIEAYMRKAAADQIKSEEEI
jgi:hypothetical protein